MIGQVQPRVIVLLLEIVQSEYMQSLARSYQWQSWKGISLLLHGRQYLQPLVVHHLPMYHCSSNLTMVFLSLLFNVLYLASCCCILPSWHFFMFHQGPIRVGVVVGTNVNTMQQY